MFLILVLLKIKVAKTGFQETKISLSFQEVVHSLYTVQMNTWTIFLRLLTILSLILHHLLTFQCFHYIATLYFMVAR